MRYQRDSPGVGVRVATALGVLWLCLTGALEVLVPEDPVVALVGTDATLRCSFAPGPDFSLAQLNLIWQLTDTKQLVHSFAEGRDQGSAYANRTALFPDLLAQGNARSVLRVVLSANGTYSCLVRNPVLQQDAHGSVTITGQPMTFPPEALWVTVGLSICLVALLVALAFVCWRKVKQSCEENAGAENQDGDGEGSKTALRPLKHSESKEGKDTWYLSLGLCAVHLCIGGWEGSQLLDTSPYPIPNPYPWGGGRNWREDCSLLPQLGTLMVSSVLLGVSLEQLAGGQVAMGPQTWDSSSLGDS
ncbi:CD276 antigen [Trichechus manatus latirostris]|uniref:CD276 antigen n=1 Tax=Trichechus manatus latirostris TaxID=127582 RepID=A0A2Y9FYH9_TRIMA|nr:CD276 antigen [Trichechus manatus latirostris]